MCVSSKVCELQIRAYVGRIVCQQIYACQLGSSTRYQCIPLQDYQVQHHIGHRAGILRIIGNIQKEIQKM